MSYHFFEVYIMVRQNSLTLDIWGEKPENQWA